MLACTVRIISSFICYFIWQKMYQTWYESIYLSSNCHSNSGQLWSESDFTQKKKAPIYTGLVQLITDTTKKNYQLMLLNKSWKSSFTSWITSTNRRIRVEELISFSGLEASLTLFTGGRRTQRRPFCALCIAQILNEKQGKTSSKSLHKYPLFE